MSKAMFVVHTPNFLGLGCEEDRARISRHQRERHVGFRIHSFYVDGDLERKVGFDICSFVSGEIRDVPIQPAAIFDCDDVEHEAQIVLVEKDGRRHGFLVAPGQEEAERAKSCLIRQNYP